MARGLSHRGLRRLPDRSPRPPRRDHRNRRRILPPQRSNRTLRETRPSTPWSQTMIAKQPERPPCHSPSTPKSRPIGRRSRPSRCSNSSTTSETKSARTTASSCSNSAANNTCTPAPIKTTAKSTINRSEHHNLKGPKQGPFVSQRSVTALCMVLHRQQHPLHHILDRLADF